MDADVGRAPLVSRFSGAGLRPPRKLTLTITGLCNLDCRHCWPGGGPEHPAGHVPAGVLLPFVRGMVQQAGVREICITGGEPFMHPELFTVLDCAVRQPGLERLEIQTNATMITGMQVERLQRLRFPGLCVQVSIDGAYAQTHDLVRGSGSFQQTLRGLRRLVAGGLPTLVACTEMDHNCMELPALLDLVEELGAGGLTSGTLVAAGRAKMDRTVALPQPSQYRELLTLFAADPGFRSRYGKLANIAAIEWWLGKSTSVSENCGCAEMPYIDAFGCMYPCLMLPAERYAVPGVFDRSVDDVMREAVERWAEIPALFRRRSMELPECRACIGRRHCRGGCMGRAYAVHGDLMTVEDRCALRQAVYAWEAPECIPAPSEVASFDGR